MLRYCKMYNIVKPFGTECCPAPRPKAKRASLSDRARHIFIYRVPRAPGRGRGGARGRARGAPGLPYGLTPYLHPGGRVLMYEARKSAAYNHWCAKYRKIPGYAGRMSKPHERLY